MSFFFFVHSELSFNGFFFFLWLFCTHSCSVSDPKALLLPAVMMLICHVALRGVASRRPFPSLQPPVPSAVWSLHLAFGRGQNLHLVAHLLGLEDAVAVVKAQHVCMGRQVRGETLQGSQTAFRIRLE